MENLCECLKLYLERAEQALDGYSRTYVAATSVFITLAIVKLYQIYTHSGDCTLKNFNQIGFRLLTKLPYLRGIKAKKMNDVNESIVKECRKIYGDSEFVRELPQKGSSYNELMDKLKAYQGMSKIAWRQGRASGTVYSDMNDELTKIIRDVYALTAYSNPLHPEVFPEVNKMEAEVVRMLIQLFNGDNNACGVITSGGTESIVLAVKAYRDFARSTRGITEPELVLPVTAHAAFQKACQYFCVKHRPVPLDANTHKVDLKAMRKAINSNTIMLVGSACNYPHGIVDDIQAIAKLGLDKNIPVHVDCCLGGFLVPFVREAGFELEPVDFSVPGVTSISADTHKYGYAPKGSSVVMFSSRKYRHHQFSVQTDWPGGIYASPTIAGSRAGACIATCWAALMHMGRQGYVEATKKILTTQRYMLAELKKMNGIYVIGEPALSVIAVASDHFNIYRLSDMLGKKGWNCNPLQFPSGFHICITLMHVQKGVANAFLNDMRQCLAVCMADPGKKEKEGMGVIYGLAQSIPDRTMVQEIACKYLDSILATDLVELNEQC